jgi:hypothetical protein
MRSGSSDVVRGLRGFGMCRRPVDPAVGRREHRHGADGSVRRLRGRGQPHPAGRVVPRARDVRGNRCGDACQHGPVARPVGPAVATTSRGAIGPRVDRVVRGRRLVGGQPSVRDDRLVEAAGNRREITYRCGTDAWSRLGAIGTRGAIGLGPGNHCEVAISRDTGWSEACNRCRAIGPRPAIGPGPATTRDTPSSEGSAAGPGWAGARDEELVNWPQATAGRPDRRSPAPAGPGQTAPRSGRRSTGV